jgi:nitrogen fixation protein FixH
MRSQGVKRLAGRVCLCAVLVAAACTRETPAPKAHEASPVSSTAAEPDGATVTFTSTPDPPAAGSNALEVAVRGQDGAPVTDATVTAVFSMPAMPAMNMPAMRSEAQLAHAGGGRYRGQGELSMGGTWNVAVTVTRGGTPLAIKRFSVVAK